MAGLCLGAYQRASGQGVTRPVNATERTDQVLQPGDKVRLNIWREPDLSGEFVVAEDGVVVFPKIGRVLVGQLSTDSVQHLLVTQYSLSLRDPSIEVTALRRVSITGAVRNPGFYYGDPTVTINGAVALAGGVTPDGNQDRLELVHRGMREPTRFSRASSLADSSIQSGDEVRVPQRSWFSRNIGFVGAGITAAAILISATIRHY
jgi:protein involved in polysaccharide export with SLBB domain